MRRRPIGRRLCPAMRNHFQGHEILDGEDCAQRLNTLLAD